jgi:dGTPase
MSNHFTVKIFRAAQNAISRGIYMPKGLRDYLKAKPLPEDTKESIVKRRSGSKMYSDADQQRPFFEPFTSSEEKQKEYRSEFRRDYGRIVHSPGFRRLQGKTQLFPSFESDFFRNRLTHSMEVAQIAKAIATKINYEYFKDDRENRIDLDLIEVAALAHDMGHPPFGHQGEEALNECMCNHGGFEGNAQTLRLLARIEKKRMDGHLECGGFEKPKKGKHEDKRFGLNLTYRALASVLKYDKVIPDKIPKKKGKLEVQKGYYKTEAELVEKIKIAISGKKDHKVFRTIECWIMDIADDIAYSTFDLEDAFKAGFIKPIDIINLDKVFHDKVSKRVNKENARKGIKTKVDPEMILDIVSDLFKDALFKLEIFKGLDKMDQHFFGEKEFKYLSAQYADRYSYYIAQDGYTRAHFISQLVDDALCSVEFKPENHLLALSKVELKPDAQIRIEILKQIAFQTQILSAKLKIAEYRGKEIVKKIFDALIRSPALLPSDIATIYYQCDPAVGDDKTGPTEGDLHRYRVVCDYIACMTDKYAIELYGRLTSETPATIFKPY